MGSAVVAGGIMTPVALSSDISDVVMNMNSAGQAVLTSALTTGAVAGVGVLLLSQVARRRPAWAAFGAPIVIVAALAAGVAVATGGMLLEGDTFTTMMYVLAAAGLAAIMMGVIMARRISKGEAEIALERAEAQRLRESEASRRETIRWLSHDIRTPLAGIRALAETIESGVSDDIPASASRVIVQVDRLDAMVADIAELSRLHTSAQRSVKQVDLDDLVSEAVATVAPVAQAREVTIAAGKLAGDVVNVDAREMGRAVTNLVRNAVQHTTPGGQVIVSTDAVNGAAWVSVRDGCGGIPQDDLPRLFEAGFRGDDARHESGMGLGLTISSEIASGHGGQLTLQNLPDGTGCEAIIELPRTATREPVDAGLTHS